MKKNKDHHLPGGKPIHYRAFSREVSLILDVSGVTNCKTVRTPKKNAVAALGMVEGVKRLTNKGNMKGLM